ncbi:MAG: hypothetical protein EAZ95_10800 [Bacteroidetes bacterium]|nr:MAG: hypothetical protein EAZ95_10800 [Bacteroidota bacterium]
MNRVGKFLCMLGWLLGSLPAWAQLNENFGDGNFTANPVWTPNLASDWTIDNGQLRSNASTTNYNFYISTPQTLATVAQWEMKINLQFNTSGTNYVDVYLTSQEANLQSSGNNGYFLRIGGSPDEISLYKLTAGASTLLIDGANGRTNTSNNNLKIKVIRDNLNLWTVYSDISGTGNDYQIEGSPTADNSHTTSAFFGFRVQQSTASFVNKHFFDDIVIGEYVPDITPPTLEALEVIDNKNLELTFSENLGSVSALNTANYVANNGLGSPASATFVTGSTRKVNLNFAQTFGNQTTNTLLVQNVEDVAGNKIAPKQIDFTYIPTFQPRYNELIISEIMADPRGSAQPTGVLLPDAEYIELYNRTDKILNLKNCIISDEGSERVISTQNLLLYPNKYLLLCDAAQASAFQPFGSVVGIASFVSLTNTGERLTLRNAQAELIFTVRYDDAWYASTAKADGGWSLEMLDVQNPCLEKGNWTSSTATRGGTPAQANSQMQTLSDLTAPLLLRAEAIDAQTVRLTFNEKMDFASLQTASYQMSNGISVQNITIQEPEFSRLTLTVSPSLQAQTVYNLTVSNAKDCNQNVMASTSLPFALPTADAQGDIILNEILFNPRTGGTDFVELYNASNKYINLKDWKIANVQDGIVANQLPITTEALILAPKSYLLLTEEPNLTLSHYPRGEARNFFEIADLPTYNDDEGTVVLLNAQNTERERFFYLDDFHFPLLDSEEGVSLERISPTLPTHDRHSWHSASERVGFGTPGYLNSQTQSQAPQDSEIQVLPAVFTPDADGQDDFAQLFYKFSKNGYVLTAVVYDRQGRKIKTLAENQLLGTEEGVINWDGTTQTQSLAPQGYYVVVVKVFDTQGTEKVFRKPVAVGIRF